MTNAVRRGAVTVSNVAEATNTSATQSSGFLTDWCRGGGGRLDGPATDTSAFWAYCEGAHGVGSWSASCDVPLFISGYCPTSAERAQEEAAEAAANQALPPTTANNSIGRSDIVPCVDSNRKGGPVVTVPASTGCPPGLVVGTG